MRRILRMKKLITVVVCAGIPMIISTILQRMFQFSDNIMVAIYFVMLFILFFLFKKKGWI